MCLPQITHPILLSNPEYQGLPVSYLLVLLFKFFFNPSVNSLEGWNVRARRDHRAHLAGRGHWDTHSKYLVLSHNFRSQQSWKQNPGPPLPDPGSLYTSYCLLIDKNSMGPELYMASGIEFSSIPMMTTFPEPKAGARWQIWVSLGRLCRIFDTGIPASQNWDMYSYHRNKTKNYTFPIFLKGLV